MAAGDTGARAKGADPGKNPQDSLETAFFRLHPYQNPSGTSKTRPTFRSKLAMITRLQRGVRTCMALSVHGGSSVYGDSGVYSVPAPCARGNQGAAGPLQKGKEVPGAAHSMNGRQAAPGKTRRQAQNGQYRQYSKRHVRQKVQPGPKNKTGRDRSRNPF